MTRQNMAFASREFVNDLMIRKGKNRASEGARMAEAVRWIFDEVVAAVPQWSGHLASNFTISVNGEAAPNTNKLLVENWKGMIRGIPRDPVSSGDHLAVDKAERRNNWALNDHVYKVKDSIMFSFFYDGGYGLPDDVRAVNFQGDILQRMSQLIKGSYKGGGQYWQGGSL